MRLSSYRSIRRFRMAAAIFLGLAGLVCPQRPQQPGRGGRAAAAPQAGQPAPAPEIPPPNLTSDPILRPFTFRSIGPATMMGRVDDIAGSEKDPMIIYVGYA